MSVSRREADEDQSGLLIGLDHPVASEAEVAPLAKYAWLTLYVALLAVGYYLAARFGLGFRFPSSQIGVIWPANAVLLSALLLTPKNRWWLVLSVAGLAHAAAVGSSVPVWRWMWQIAGNSVFTMATVYVLRRFAGLPLHFGSRRQVIAYTALSFVMPTLFGFTTPAFVRSLLHFDSTYSPTVSLLRAMLSNSTALLLVAPVIVLWGQYGLPRLRALRPHQLLEAAAVVVSLLAVGLLALSGGPEIARIPGLLLWFFPPLLWAAIRFGPLGASTSLFLVATLSLWGMSQQLGPFVLSTHADQVLLLQLFWMALCPPVALLAAVIRERELAELTLQDQRNQLAHVTRVATAGELSAALAHELRQPLTSILASAEAANDLLARRAPNLDEVREILNDIVLENKVAANIIARVQSFLRKDEPHFESVDVESVVRDALALARSTIHILRVEVQLQVADGLARVRGDRVQLLQVVLNLVMNACESMNGVPIADRQLQFQIAPTNDQQVEVLIADHGQGLPAGGEDRVFEPFFTTKSKGLGLGLAIGRSIATAHGGRLWGENNKLGGSTFHLVLPTENANV